MFVGGDAELGQHLLLNFEDAISLLFELKYPLPRRRAGLYFVVDVHNFTFFDNFFFVLGFVKIGRSIYPKTIAFAKICDAKLEKKAGNSKLNV